MTLTAEEVMQLIQSLIWLLAGVGVFIVGMNFMGDALEKSAGSGMKRLLERISNNRFSGVGIGAGVTAIIQSSSATSVMVIGLVNAGVMTLMQATPIIMGANIGTTITGVLVALKNDYFNMAMYLLAFAGVMMGFAGKEKIKIAGSLCSGLGLIFVGLNVMSSEQAFGNPLVENMFTEIFKNIDFPLLLILVGVIFTALIQSSSASTGVVITMVGAEVLPLNLALFIILGANIGTCVTALLASVGANANSKRVALIHFTFNTIGTILFTAIIWIFQEPVVNFLVSLFPGDDPMSLQMRVSIFHVIFNVTTTAILLPFVKQLVKYSCFVIKDKKDGDSEAHELLDDRLLSTPTIAIERSRAVAIKMARKSIKTFKDSLNLLFEYDEKGVQEVRDGEDKVDKYEDALGTYLVKVSNKSMNEADSHEVSKLLHIIGDFERISDHAVNVAESATEIHDKGLSFSEEALKEIKVMIGAINEILDISLEAFENNDLDKAVTVEPLEQVIDTLKLQLKSSHVTRLRKKECTIEMGFILSDLVTNLERVSDHCSNVAVCIIEIAHDSFDMHNYIQKLKDNVDDNTYNAAFEKFSKKYAIKTKEA